MRVCVFVPPPVPASFEVYASNVARELAGHADVEIVRHEQADAALPAADVYWDPRAGGGNAPHPAVCNLAAPLVVTLHGVAPFVLPMREYSPTLLSGIRGRWSNRAKRRRWGEARSRYQAVITVSDFARRSIVEHLPIDPGDVFVCHHGVAAAFFDAEPGPPEREYWFHVSNDAPGKNVDRIIEAYRSVEGMDLPLLLALQGSTTRVTSGDVRVTSERLDEAQMAAHYRRAAGLVFPSLHESFGLPIVEAMASGCPVITSNDTACAEVAGDAALLVPPRSATALADGLTKLARDPALREDLRQKGLARARRFTWQASATAHLRVFEEAIRRFRGAAP